ncbi:MAG TPA: hypothetical protein QF753_16685 [Victivallales bacterium]|nr:hypothetical protein [Victivallales bacterium]
MKLKKNDKFFFISASAVCIFSLILYTIIHIIYYNPKTYSVYNLLPEDAMSGQVIFQKILSYIICVGFLILLFYAVKKYIYNYRYKLKSKFLDKIVIFIFLCFIAIDSPFIQKYIFTSGITELTSTPFWSLFNFIGVASVVIFSLTVLADDSNTR